MSTKNQWSKSLGQALDRLAAGSPALKLAVLGVGNELDTEDAAGVMLERCLVQKLQQAQNLLLLDGGTVPENQSGALRRFEPDLILILDAAELGEAPGTVKLLSPEQADGFSGSTHSLPLSMLARYLADEIGCTVLFLALQPPTTQTTHESIAAEIGRRLEPYLQRAN
ncbi:MAG: hydrogenase maturation protease [Anaerolineales bacterium]